MARRVATALDLTNERASANDASRVELLSRPSLHLEIVPVLREMIMTGALAEGESIREAELCQRLGVSKTPLREALKVLAFDRWVELLPNRGTAVTRVTLSESVELFEILEGMEALVGTLAAERMSDEELWAITKLHTKLGQHLRASRERDYFETSQRIHKAIVRSTRNNQLVSLHENLSQRVRRARVNANLSAGRRSASHDEHGEIMEALAARDAVRLSKALREHASATGAAVAAALLAREAADRG